MESQPSPFLIVAAFLVVFAVLWVGIMMLGARFGGWGEFAKIYRGPPSMAGEVCTYAGAHFRWFYGYNRCLTISISEQGIHMLPMFAFRMHHPPLMIPWDKVLEVQDKSVILFPRVEMTVASDDPAAPFTVNFKGKRLVETLGRYWALEAQKRHR